MGSRIRQVLAAGRTVASGELARYGGQASSRLDAFEADLANAFDVPHARGVNSGTSALMCCLAALGVGEGDEVLVPAYTWVSSAAAAVAVGAIPILVEVDESLTIDPTDLEAKITDRTAAIIPVHMLNVPADMDSIMAVADRHGVPVVEDAAQAIGVTYQGRHLGTIGRMGIYSFQQNKNIRSGEGGAFVTADADLFERASQFHDVGRYQRPADALNGEPGPTGGGPAPIVGLNLRMPEMAAAVLRPQLRDLPKQMRARAKRREIFAAAAASIPGAHVAPHHDEAAAVALTVVFDAPDDAAAFAASVGGSTRLIDTGRHIYENWESILARRTFDDRTNPWRERDLDYAGSCPRTLDVLARSVHVSTGADVPMPVVRRRAGAMEGWRA